MNTVELLSHLRRQDVKLWADGDRLRCNAPKGVLTPNLQAEISERKAEILEFLRSVGSGLEGLSPEITPTSREHPLCLSFSQQRLWVLDQLEPGNPAFNMPLAMRLRGPLDVPVLGQCFSELIRRHETLRTSFIFCDGQPMQVIRPYSPFQLTVTGWPVTVGKSYQEEANRLAREEAQTPFNLAQGPLFRVKLVRFDEQDHLLLLTLHHIIADGWSLNVLAGELAALYQAFSVGHPSPLPDLPIQYADFAVWQRDYLQGEVLEQHLSYWRNRLNELPVLALPEDHQRPEIQTYSGDNIELRLSFELSSGLRQMSQQEGATLFMVLLAGFKLLLSRLSGQEDIVVGSPIANRNRIEVEGLIGCFVNNLVLRTDLTGEPTFRQLIERVRRVTVGAYAHQDIPFEKILEELHPERNLDRTPFFQVLFNMLDIQPGQLKLPDITVEIISNFEIESKFDFTLYIDDSEPEIRLDLVYNRDLFSRARMQELLAQYSKLLEQVVIEPEQTISRYSLLTPQSRVELPNPIHPLLPSKDHKLLPLLITGQAHKNPLRTAIKDPFGEWTYDELEGLSNSLANHLAANGIKPGDTVCVYAHRSASLIWALLSVWKAGAAFLILDPDYPASRLVEYVRQAKPNGWLQMDAAGSLPGELVHCLPYFSICCHANLPKTVPEALAAFGNSSAEPAQAPLEPDSLAYVAFTSGSTGSPKGILGTHRPLSHFFNWHINTFGLGETDRFSMLSGLAHDPLLRDIFTPLILGATLFIPGPEEMISPEGLADWLQRNNISVSHLTPPLGQFLVAGARAQVKEANQFVLNHLRYAFFGGDTLSSDLVQRFRRHAPYAICVNFYGATETPQAMSWQIVSPSEERDRIPIGKGIPCVQLLVLNSAGQLCGTGEQGEIFIRTPYLSKGYLDDAELTRQKFISNPFTLIATDRIYRTGDLGRYLPDGAVEFAGRKDQQVKIRGFRIELGEIEAVLRQHDSVKDAAVTLREDTPGNPILAAYVVLDRVEQRSQPDLRHYLTEKLPAFMLPTALVTLDRLPLTPNGKIDRRALPAPEVAHLGLHDEYVSPRNPVEEMLAGIWEGVLGRDRIGVEDNFFEMGGHSLLATQLVSRIRSAFDIDLPLRSLFENQTIASLAKRIEADQSNTQTASLHPIVPVPRNQDLPLSFSQLRQWFLQGLEPETSAYHISGALRLQGVLNIPALEQSLGEIYRQHESLRTTFSTRDDQPIQEITPPGLISLPVIDLQTEPASNRENKAYELAREESQRPFDLTQGPLIRVTLVRLEPEDHILLVTMHHIISDGWSMGVFWRELTELYTAFDAGIPVQLPELPVQYSDYAKWQHQWLQGDTLERLIDYWWEKLNGLASPLQLPTDRPRPPVQTTRGRRQPFKFSGPVTREMIRLGQREGVSLFMILLSGLNTLLYRYTGETDLCVGTYIANRNRPEIENLIGFFVNTLALRNDLSGNPSFRELLSRTRQTALGAYAHQDLPFEKVIEVIQPERSLSHTPFFQVMMVLQNSPMPDARPAGLTISELAVEFHRANFDLTFWIYPGKEEITGHLEYNIDLFNADTITRMITHLQALIESAISNPDLPISHLSILPDTERRQILVEWNRPQPKDLYLDGEIDLCVHQWFESQAARSPNSCAIWTHQGQELTYGELNRRANQLAHYLRAKAVGLETPVGLCVERSPEMIVGILGILKAGGCYVPLDPSQPFERLAYMLQDSGTTVLLTQARQLAKLKDLSVQIICLDNDWGEISRESGDNLFPIIAAENLAYIIYTSGSTGAPKGVMVEHGSLASYTRFAGSEFGVSPRDRVLQFASVSFDTSAEEIFPCLTRGATLVLRTEPMLATGAEFLKKCQEWQITLLDLPTAYWHELTTVMVQERLTLPPPVRLVIIGGEEAQAERLLQWQERTGSMVRLINTYGPTEATIVSTYCDLTEIIPVPGSAARLPIGRPISTARTYVLDSHLQPVPTGVPGELYISGPGLARGYINQPELTAQKFLPNHLAGPTFGDPGNKGLPFSRLYRTGDLARWRPDGNLEFLGRVDRQVKIRGFRVELGEIETVIHQHPSVREAVVNLAVGSSGEHRLVAYVVADDHHVASGSQLDHPAALQGILREYLKSRLPEYMVPSFYMILDAFPLTASGKLDRKTLPVPDMALPGGNPQFVAPRNPIEAMVASIWEEVLRTDRIGVHDNFFDWGGQSLIAMQVISRLRKAFGVEIPVRSLFENPTVADLAGQIEFALKSETRVQSGPMKPAPREDLLPLAFSQERMWFIHQIQPESSAYNIPVAVRITGNLSVSILEQGLNEVIRRHEILRTSIHNIDGQPVQVIAPSLEVSLPLIDLRHLPPDERESSMLGFARDQAKQPFDLEKAPLFRTSLFQLDEEVYVVLGTLHHAIFDAWSLGIFGREILTLYEAYSNGERSPLPEISVQYADFAAWQRQLFQGEILERQMDYWREQLSGVPVLELPTDKTRPSVQTFNGASQTIHPDKSLFEALRRLSREESATLFMTLLAVFKLLLSRYTGQLDLAVGVPIANRHWLDTEDLIGTFVNTLVLRTDLSGEPGFRDVLRRVRDNALEAYAHQDLPFEKLVAELQPERDLSHSPLFQVMFDYTNVPTETRQMADLQWTPLEVHRGASQFDLTMTVIDTELSQQIRLEYNTDLFEAETISRMLGHFLRLMEGIIANPEEPVSRLTLLTEAEVQQILIDWNETQYDYPKDVCLHQLFERQADRTPDDIAVQFADQTLTYRELNQRSNRLAHYLRALGIDREKLVAIGMERSLEMIVGLLGILKAGGAYVPLDPAFPPDRLAFMLSDSRVAAVLTQQRFVGEEITGLDGTPVICMDSDWSAIAKQPAGNPDSLACPTDLAYVIYTSGSTGKPKGVQIQHQSVVNFLESMRQTPGITSDDILLSVTTLSFDIAGLEIFLPLTTGARVVLLSRDTAADGPRLMAAMANSGATIMQATPTTWRMLVETGWPGDPNLKILCGGEALPKDLAGQLLARAGELWNMYGPTETTIWSLVSKVECSQSPVVIGRAIANTALYVLDKALQPLPVGVPGELFIGGDGLALGYLNRPELTREKFIPYPPSLDTYLKRIGDHASGKERLYRTGDLVRYLPDGNLEFLGRMDFQVKIRGFRVELGEIESTLSQHPGIRQAVVMVREDTPGDTRLAAYLVTEHPEAATPDELRQFARQKLPEYMVPSSFILLDAFPLTPNNKIDRKALPAPDLSRFDLAKDYVAPRTALEQVIAGVLAATLSIDQVGAFDNFFDLGGHSLLATRLISRLQNVFQVELSLRTFFEAPTVAGLAEKLKMAADNPIRIERMAELMLQLSQLTEEQADQMLEDRPVNP